MGRPPLGMKPTTIRLPQEMIQRIETLVGNRQLAQFIREAVERELERRERAEGKD
ncbi:YlcI/YnfO family protein [uncultured Sphingosinicella sp.]|uniref:YlcI/YnfO family protein n=1 Tax=uncultured Sphingosinicella sp. TaxID=478748 RepID=UPI0030DC9E2C